MPGTTLYDGQFYDQQAAGSLASARIVLGALFQLTPITSVIDIGCGVAPWVRTARDLGATDSLGLDGDYVDRARLLVEPDRFRVCDLETEDPRNAVARPLPVDLALCMEVAEHLPPARAQSFITELCALSDLVLFSAAVPGQGGTHHVNEQWPEYWSGHFAAAGFDCFDILRPRLWREEACDWWYRQNALVFARRESAAWAAMARSAPPTPAPMPLVHPRKLAQLLANEIGHIAMNRSLRAELDRRDLDLRRNRATIDGLNDRIACQDAERERLAEARAEIQSLREMLTALQAKSRQTTDALTTVKGQLSSALDSCQAQRHEHRSLRAKHDALAARLLSCQTELARLAGALRAAEAQAEALHASTSWRVTRPMRAVRRVFS